MTLHRKDKVKSLAAMRNTIKVRRLDTFINPSLMFNIGICLLNTSTEMETFLHYELAPQPLFVDDQMRKTTKIAIGNMLKSMAVCHSTVPDESGYVIDGGCLLHNNHVALKYYVGQINEILVLILIHTVGWPKPAIYQYVCNAC